MAKARLTLESYERLAQDAKENGMDFYEWVAKIATYYYRKKLKEDVTFSTMSPEESTSLGQERKRIRDNAILKALMPKPLTTGKMVAHLESVGMKYTRFTVLGWLHDLEKAGFIIHKEKGEQKFMGKPVFIWSLTDKGTFRANMAMKHDENSKVDG